MCVCVYVCVCSMLLTLFFKKDSYISNHHSFFLVLIFCGYFDFSLYGEKIEMVCTVAVRCSESITRQQQHINYGAYY